MRWNLNWHDKVNHFKVNNLFAFSVITVLCNYHLYLTPKHFRHSKKKTVSIAVAPHFLFPPSSCQSPFYILSLWIYLFCIFNINGIIQYLTCCGRLLSLNKMYAFLFSVFQFSFGFSHKIALTKLCLCQEKRSLCQLLKA